MGFERAGPLACDEALVPSVCALAGENFKTLELLTPSAGQTSVTFCAQWTANARSPCCQAADGGTAEEGDDDGQATDDQLSGGFVD